MDHDLDPFSPRIDGKFLTTTLLYTDENFIMWYLAKIVSTSAFSRAELVDKNCLNLSLL